MDVQIEEVTRSAMEEVVLSNNRFCFELFSQIGKDGAKDNVFFSPCSLSLALAMVFAGAKGKTADEMETILHWNRNNVHEGMRALKSSLSNLKKGTPGESVINVANRAWIIEGYEILSEFTSTLSKCYDSEIGAVDFASNTEGARKSINDWVEKETKEKIKELIKPGMLSSLTRLVLTNAIYFKGEWVSKFDAAQTKPGVFNLADGESVHVDTMYVSSKFKYAKIADGGYETLVLPYADRKFSMVIMLPSKGSTPLELIGNLANSNAGNLKEIIGLNSREAAVEAYIPKFKLDYQFDAKEMMKSMGVFDLFDDQSADLSGVNGVKDLYVAHVVHKAFVDVDEKGTTAAAATAVIAMTRCAVRPTQKILFRADRPFAFFIMDNYSSTVVFAGKVNDPR